MDNNIISYDFGHSEGNLDGSARGYLYEYAVVREYGQICVDRLAKAGYTMVNCTTPDGQGIIQGKSLAYRVNKANESGSFLHLCFHANSFDESANGAEIEVASNEGERIATFALDEICKIGFKRRGIKRPSLYVTKNTKAVALLFEPFFVSNKNDCDMYSKDTLGKAIADGLLKALGKYIEIPTEQPQVIETTPEEVKVEPIVTPEQTPTPQPQQLVEQPKPVDELAQKIEKAKKFVGDRCKELQEKLIKCGYDCGGYGVDGDFGKGTYGSLITFQQHKGLTVDGLAGNATFTKLDELISEMNKPKGNAWVRKLQETINREFGENLVVDGIVGLKTLGACRTIKKGAKGEFVRVIQEKLCALGYDTNGIDGLFYGGMDKAVRRFQSDNKLASDGILGQASFSVLLRK